MSKLNKNELTSYVSTLYQNHTEQVFNKIEQIAWNLMDAAGIASSDLDDGIHADFVSGLLAKLVKRHQDGKWPTAGFSSEVDAELRVTE